MKLHRFAALAAFLALIAASPLAAQMRWREIGPMRAGRTHALSGVPSQPNVFYIGAVNGGVWKTTDAGQTWQSIFDAEPSGSIGAVAVAPSDPNVVYAGSGEGQPRPDLSVGDGMYKTTDAGATWTHLEGLRDGQQIAKIVVDAHDPNRLFVAVLGHPFGPNSERGIYRSTDGGASFQRVLYKDENTGAIEVVIDPNHPNVIYAGLWADRQGPWENAAWTGTTGGLFKSSDGGDTWTQLTQGLPGGTMKVDSLAVAPSDSNRLYMPITGTGGGFFRSDDGGASWTRTYSYAHMAGGEQIVAVDPRNEDIVYDATQTTWRSTDGGHSFTGWRGSPGGDDYQNIWINPNDGNIVALTADQGAIVTVNGGRTWGQWYNQATAQMYHVTVDNAFPYRACGGQQDSGSACVSSRGDTGSITFHDWSPVGISEYGYAAPDPLDPDIVYGVGQSDVTRYDRRTGQTAEVTPVPLREGGIRTVRTMPLVFSPANPHRLYFGTNRIFQTDDGGAHWTLISPDLTRKTWAVPASVGIFTGERSAQPSQRGVVYALAPSPLDALTLWAGTDDGLVQLTSDGGKTWHDVTPPQLQPWWKVSILDAGHFDKLTAYAAINTLRLDDLRPHLFKTHDGGKSWTEIDAGLPTDEPTDVIREDPKRRGLLYAGTETQVWVSYDDGAHWSSLRENMPAVSVRDLQVKDDDLVAGTHGRGFEILDDVTPLRQHAAAAAAADAYLYAPERATRVRDDMNPPTPWPPEMANGQNPPDGAILDYVLKQPANGVVTLEIRDAAGALVRRYASDDTAPPEVAAPTWPHYWDKLFRPLPAAAGEHRIVWDLRYTRVPGMATDLDDFQAVPHDTPDIPTSPIALPGRYTVRLTVDGHTYTQPLTIRMDPRVKTTPAAWAEQFRVAKQLYDDEVRIAGALDAIQAANLSGEAARKARALAGAAAGGRGGRGGPAGAPTLRGLQGEMSTLQRQVEAADIAPTAAQSAAAAKLHGELTPLLAQWTALRGGR